MTDQDDNLPNETLNDAPGELDVESVAYDPTPLSFDEFDRQTAESAETSREIRPESPIDVDSTAVSIDDAPSPAGSQNATAPDLENVPDVQGVASDAASSANVELSEFLSSTGEKNVKTNLHIESVAKDGNSKRKKKRPRPNADQATQGFDGSTSASTEATSSASAPAFYGTYPFATPASGSAASSKLTPLPSPVRIDLSESKPSKPYEFANPLESGSSPLPKSARSVDMPGEESGDAESQEGVKQASGGISGCLGFVLFITAIFCFISPKGAAVVIPIAVFIIIAILATSSSKKSG